MRSREFSALSAALCRHRAGADPVGFAGSGAAAAAARARRWSERHGGVRRLVSEPGRPLHAARRLLQSQPQADARHSGRTEQPHRAGRSRLRPAHALPAAPAVGRDFTIKVPKDFGDKRLTWTIVANGQTTTLPIGVIKGYQIEPFKEVAQGNEPPKIQFDPKGPVFAGPPVGIGATLSGSVGQPVTLERHRDRHAGQRSRSRRRFS